MQANEVISAMGGCVATARRHSLLCLPRLLRKSLFIIQLNKQKKIWAAIGAVHISLIELSFYIYDPLAELI